MKKVTLICMLFLFLLTACGPEDASAPLAQDHSDPLPEGYGISSEPIPESAARYSLAELEAYFGNSSVVNTSAQQGATLRLHEIDQQFPVVYLRSCQCGQDAPPAYYIAYPVLEGGNFLVLLSEVMDPGSREQELGCWSAFYTRDLPDKELFADLKAGASPDDVMQIAPYTEWAIRSSANISYSLLKDGSTMQCTYTMEAAAQLLSTQLLEAGDPQNPYAGMLLSDLVQ